MARCPYPPLIQTLIFSKKLFTEDSVERWLRANGFDPRASFIRETSQSYRAIQYPKEEFVPDSFRTHRLGGPRGKVQAVVGCPFASLQARRRHPHR